MAVRCRQCGTLVDQGAAVCPHCGTPNPAGRPSGPAFAAVGFSPVVIRGVDISFGDLVVLIIKVVLAAIPAYIIIFIILAILGSFFGGLFAALVGGLMM
jgi:hypothetical protein